MKKILITLGFLSVLFFAQAQIPGFNIGPKVGYNTRELTSDWTGFTSNADGGIQFGLFARIGKKFYVQPEVDYVVKGGNINFKEKEVQIKLKSITVPLLLGYKIIDAKVFNIRLAGGPVYSKLIDKTVPVGDLIDFPIKSKEDLKDATWSIQLGGGIDVMNFTIDVRYELGVDNLYIGDQDFNLKNNLLNVSLGLKLL